MVGQRLIHAEFNGLASGNTLAEALLHGLCELIERDVCVRWLHHRPPALCVPEAAVLEPTCRTALARLRGYGVAVRIFDLGAFGPVRIFAASSFDRGLDNQPVTPVVSAAHIDPQVALARTVTELVQARANAIFLRQTAPGEVGLAVNERLAEETVGSCAMAPPLEASAPVALGEQLEKVLIHLREQRVDVLCARLGSGVVEVVRLVPIGLQPLTAGVDYWGEVSALSERLTPRLEEPWR